ncbi:hypothetical protein OIU77_004056 [Salix suchowensis]|uniref:Uncharacterized protein n=1 Tax=Salix suchowensis TaxID=1278906 RepID=A0ABQ9AT62_9ROSI|nr:hypothetical protein OIU77_004056 [Salix suchowensis]
MTLIKERERERERDHHQLHSIIKKENRREPKIPTILPNQRNECKMKRTPHIKGRKENKNRNKKKNRNTSKRPGFLISKQKHRV